MGKSTQGKIGFISPVAEFTPKTVETTELHRFGLSVEGLCRQSRLLSQTRDASDSQTARVPQENDVNETLVAIQDLSKVFKRNLPAAIDGMTTSIPKGKIVGLAGPDGSGKTTLIRLIAGLLVPTKGTITVAGYDTAKNPEPIHSLTGYMPQKFGLYEDLTVMENLVLYADLHGVVGKERELTFEKLLKLTDLAHFTDRLAGDLSGGMKQKLGLACALIKKPLLLLLDEPSVGVDPISRRELWKMVTSLVDEGISVVWSTAYLNELEHCDTVLLLSNGKLLYDGTPKQLTERVERRVFRVTNIEGSRRKLLFQLLNEKGVIDGVIQGSDLRIVTKEKGLPSFSVETHFTIEEQPPRFEDAFIDILGGGPGGRSELAEMRPPITENEVIPVSAEKLTKTFGTFTAVKEVSFTIKKGEIFGLVRAQWRGQIHYLQDALWSASTYNRNSEGKWLRSCHSSRGSEISDWLHGPKILSLWDVKRETKPLLLCRDLQSHWEKERGGDQRNDRYFFSQRFFVYHLRVPPSGI